MTEGGMITIVGQAFTMVTVLGVAYIQRKASKRRDVKLEEIHQEVNGAHGAALAAVATLKGEVGRLNESTSNTTPEDGGAVNLRHGQVVVSREPEIKK